MKISALTGALVTFSLAATAQAQTMEIVSNDERPTVIGSSDYFVGHALINPLFNSTDYTRATAGEVTFSPRARSNWHVHPAGQTLVITSGSGWIQQRDGEKYEVKAGDVIWTPPGVEHWHGATDSNSMSHIAVQERVDGNNVEWMEPVSDEQYSE